MALMSNSAKFKESLTLSIYAVLKYYYISTDKLKVASLKTCFIIHFVKTCLELIWDL